ncbi:MAG: CDP-glycerol--glycerophosphate glycerophosphotransferase [Woeseia sp.]|nr:CDP-glycerol--glycerophosphate glycerophosphotransferase [Woeseia sp.]
MRRLQSLPQSRRYLSFYSEGPAYWVHLEPLVRHLLSDHKIPLCYFSSSPDDPGLNIVKEHGETFLIGDGAVRTVLFKSFPPGVLVMTMPDLENFHIKRSVHPVHYVYVQHSMVSTHMVYRSTAFDHFDTVFCAGPHHVAETRAREQLMGLPKKQLIEHGYGRLDNIMAMAPTSHEPEMPKNRELRLLLAPSWGPNGLIETKGQTVTKILLDAGFHLTLRPHPQTSLLSPSVIRELSDSYSRHPSFVLEDSVVSADSLYSADLMISDWSGVAMEFAFCMERPVLFIDVARKMRNSDYMALQIDPLEVKVRNLIGDVLATDHLHELPQAIKALADNKQMFQQQIRTARNEWVFNLGQSGAVGAAQLAKLHAKYA